MSKLFLNLYDDKTLFSNCSYGCKWKQTITELSTHWTVMGVNKLYFGMHATNT